MRTSLPYGLRDVKILPYTDLEADTFGVSLVDLPNAQTFQWNESEDFDELRGDDKTVTSHGKGAKIEWELDSGGLSIDAYTSLAGGEAVSSGISPNQRTRYRKGTNDQRPFFTVIGQAISDSGGDLHTIVWLCRVTGNLEQSFKDGEFMIPGASGIGYPCRVTGNVDGDPILDSVYDIIQHETATAIVAPALDTPAIPVVESLDDITGPQAGGEIIRVYGTGFSTATAVNFTATPATDFTIVSDHEIIAISPAHAAGATNVRVTNPTGQSATSASNVYTYV